MTTSPDRTADDLHGNAPDCCEVALLFIDLINDLEFPEGPQIARRGRGAGKRLAALKQRALRAGVPCVYVNDNFGRWRSDFNAQVRHCLRDSVRGEALCSLLKPTANDYFVLKPKHSGFYQTCLEILLRHLRTETLLLCGIATESCVTFTAHDAFLRGFKLLVVDDGCISSAARLHRAAVDHMRTALGARVAKCSDIHFVRSAEDARVRIARR